MGFGKHIKALREKQNISAQKVAEWMGVDAARLRKWEEKDLNPREADTAKIESAFGCTIDKILELDRIPLFQYVPKSDFPGSVEEKDESASYLTQRRDLKNNGTKKRLVPLFDAPTAAGLIETEMTPIHAPAGAIDVGDLLDDSQAALRIYGNSMLPGYPPGCVVGLIKVSGSYIEPGEVYVIETRDGRVLKRLFYKEDNPDSEDLMCVSDNNLKFESGARNGKLAYPPFYIKKAEVINLFAVTGTIKRNRNSIIINRGL